MSLPPGFRLRELTRIERAHMLDAARGYTAAESAARRQVSTHTVNSSLKSAKRALGARNITHAVALCLAYGEFGTTDVRGTR